MAEFHLAAWSFYCACWLIDVIVRCEKGVL